MRALVFSLAVVALLAAGCGQVERPRAERLISDPEHDHAEEVATKLAILHAAHDEPMLPVPDGHTGIDGKLVVTYVDLARQAAMAKDWATADAALAKAQLLLEGRIAKQQAVVHLMTLSIDGDEP